MTENIEKQLPYELSLPYLRSKFWAVAQKQGWAGKKGPAVVAVSGGSDSVALLWFFVQFWPGKVVVAHLEHGIRGKTSFEDADFVKALAKQWHCDLQIKHVAVPQLLEKGETLEEGARRIRYDFLEYVSSSCQAEIVALGHTADDVAETLLFNLCRGSGPFGLVGIPEVREQYVRPLINWWREDLQRLLTARGITWRTDPTNSDTVYARNRIRHEVIPMLEKTINPSTRQHLVDLAQDMQEYRQREEEQGALLLQWAKRDFPFSFYAADLAFIRSLSDQEIAWFIRAVGRDLNLKTLTRNRLNSLVSTIRKSGRWLFQWENRVFICCGSGFMVWINPKLLYNTHATPLELTFDDEEGRAYWGVWSVSWEKKQSVPKHLNSSLKVFWGVYPLRNDSCLSLSSLTSKRGMAEKNTLKKIPWWLEKIWPFFGDKDRWRWIPIIEDFSTPSKEFSNKNSWSGPWIILRLEPHSSALEG